MPTIDTINARFSVPKKARAFHLQPNVSRVRLASMPEWRGYFLVRGVRDARDLNRVGEIIVSFQPESSERYVSTLTIDTAYRQPDRVRESLERADGLLQAGVDMLETLRMIGLDAKIRTPMAAHATSAALKLYAANYLWHGRTKSRIFSQDKIKKAVRLRDSLGRENWGMVCACATSAIAYHGKQIDLDQLYRAHNAVRRAAADALMVETDVDLTALYAMLERKDVFVDEFETQLARLMIKPYFFAAVWSRDLIADHNPNEPLPEDIRSRITAVFLFEAGVLELSMLLSDLKRHPEQLDSYVGQALRYMVYSENLFILNRSNYLERVYADLQNEIVEKLAELLAISGVSDIEIRRTKLKKLHKRFTHLIRDRMSIKNVGPWSGEPFLLT